MSELHTVPRWKRFLFCFSVLISLILLNLSVFSFRARANSASSSYDLYTIGSPVRFELQDLSGTDILINRPNVYYYELDGSTPTWYEGTSTSNYSFRTEYSVRGNGVADMFLTFPSAVSFSSVAIDRPIFFTDYNDLASNFNFTLGLNSPKDRLGYSLSSLEVIYNYYFLYATPTSDGSFLVRSRVVSDTVTVPVNTSSNYAYVSFYSPYILTSSLLSELSTFVSSINSTKYCWLEKATLTVPSAFVSQSYIEPLYVSASRSLSSYESSLDAITLSVYRAQTVSPVILFSNLDWTSWLTSSVGAFMNFEIVPGLSISGIFALLIGMSLFMIFLKVFAGG